MDQIFPQLLKLTRNRKIMQVGTLYLSMVLSMGVGIAVSVVNTRFLGAQQYGDFKFLQSLFAFFVTFLTWGYFYSGSRLLAQHKNEAIKHQLIAGLLLFAAGVSIALAGGLFIFSFFEEEIFGNNLGRIIRIFSPLLFVLPFQICLEQIMQGDNRIYELSIFRISPKFLYLIAAIAFNAIVPLTLTAALAIHLGCMAVLIIIMTFRLKPEFKNINVSAQIIRKENRNYGVYVYAGIIANVATLHLSGLSIGYFIDNTNVGFFSLAVTVTTPLAMISSSVGTALYKDFADKPFIPNKVTLVTIMLSFCALLFFLLFIRQLILVLYSAEFIPVVPLAYIVAAGSVFRGLGDFYNRFLGANGKGREIRNSAYANGLSNVFGYIFLVYAFGVMGAAVARLVSDLIYWLTMFFYYKRHEMRFKTP